MDREQAKIRVKDRLEEYLASKGINIRKPFLCLNPEHNEKTPSMSFDQKRNKAHCFGCGADYDTFDLIGIDYGLTDPNEIFNTAYEHFGITIDGAKLPAGERKQKKDASSMKNKETGTREQNSTPLAATQTADQLARMKADIERFKGHVQETDYFSQRGFSQGTIQSYGLGYDPSLRAAIIPIGEGYYIRRIINPGEGRGKYKNPSTEEGGGMQLMNLKHLEDSTEPVFVTEGAFCAVSIEQAGGRAIALNSTAGKRIFIDRCKKLHGEGRQLPIIVLALDPDAEGSKTSDEISAALQHMGASVERLEFPDAIKDPNEWLISDSQTFNSAIISITDKARAEAQAEAEAERSEYMSTNTAQYMERFFDHIKDKENTKAIPTGFTELDKTLDGGLYPGLYVMGAISSLGKTTVALQICDNIAASGKNVLIFSLEMARFELMAKSLSRHSFILDRSMGKQHAKTTRNITTYSKYQYYTTEELDLIQAAVDEYSEAGKHIFIHEGIGDIGPYQIRETVERHIRITGNTPVVLIDYLQILAPADVRATDKQNTDKAVTELKRLSRDLKTPVLAISSLNRDNYTNQISMSAFKESGAIEYSSDVLIGLQFSGITGKAEERVEKIEEAKRKDPREIELKILKNRNGRTGDTLKMAYYPRFNLFKE